jgi:putative flippase GtrA
MELVKKFRYLINDLIYYYNINLDFIKFCLVGFSALILESFLIFLLYQIGISYEYSRLISLPLAILFTWYFNRNFTFRNRAPNKIIQFGTYTSLILIGLVVNYSVYIFSINLLKSIDYSFIIAICLGSSSSLVFNFVFSKFKVFK